MIHSSGDDRSRQSAERRRCVEAHHPGHGAVGGGGEGRDREATLRVGPPQAGTVRPLLGEAEPSHRPARAGDRNAGGRPGRAAHRRACSGCRCHRGREAGTPAVAGAFAPRGHRARCALHLPRLRRPSAQDRHRDHRDAGACTGTLQGDPARAGQALLPCLRYRGPGRGP